MMAYVIKLFIIYGCFTLITKRKEEIPILTSKIFPSSAGLYFTTFFDFIKSKIFYIVWLSYKTLIYLLIIGGIESNPGPQSSNTKLNSFSIERKFKDFCPIKHLCEIKNCSGDVYASCHCNQCQGYGPLLCFNHFVSDKCPFKQAVNRIYNISPSN